MNDVRQKMGDINTTSCVASSVIVSIKVSDYKLLRDNNGWGHASTTKWVLNKALANMSVCVCVCVFDLVSKWHIQKQANPGQR